MLSDEQISVKLFGLEFPTSVNSATASFPPEGKFRDHYANTLPPKSNDGFVLAKERRFKPRSVADGGSG